MILLQNKQSSKFSFPLILAASMLLPALAFSNAGEINGAVQGNTTSVTATENAAKPSRSSRQGLAQAASVDDLNRLKRTVSKLDLNVAQKDQVAQIFKATDPQVIKIREELKTNREHLKPLMYTTQYNSDKVNTLAKKQGQLISELITLRAKLTSDVYSILTPTQQKNFELYMEDRDAARQAAKKAKLGGNPNMGQRVKPQGTPVN